MNRHTIALAGAATAVLVSAAAMATAAGDTPGTIEACRNIRHGLVRIVFDQNSCKSNEVRLSWDAQGPAGPAGPAGAPGQAGPAGPPGPKGDPGGGSHRSTASPARPARRSAVPPATSRSGPLRRT